MSRRMDKEEFDRMFDQAFEEAVREIDQTPTDAEIEASWKRVEQRLRQEKRKRQWRRRVQMISVAAASLLVGALLLSPGQMTSALQPMYKLMKGFQEGMITFFVQSPTEDHSGAKTPPPPDLAHSNNTSTDEKGEQSGGVLKRGAFSSLEEAQDKTSFHIFVPSTLPAGYVLEQVDLFFEEGAREARSAQMEYSHADGSTFDIIQFELLPRTSIASGVHESAGTVQEVQVLGSTAYLVNFKSGRRKLELLIDNVMITVIGDLSEEEILNVASSLK